MDNQAIMPDADELEIFTEDIAEQQDSEQADALKKDQELVAIQHDPRWKTFEDLLNFHIVQLRTGAFLGGEIASMKLEEVGQKYVIASTVAEICQELLDVVTNATESVVNEDAKRKAAARQQPAQ